MLFWQESDSPLEEMFTFNEVRIEIFMNFVL
jgi:hypothetical protein